MSRIIEHDIIQNISIGALALHKFTNTFFNKNGNLKGPTIAHSMPVLPILFHQDTLKNISSKRFEGGFFNALNDYRELPAGLQQRMEQMADQTFKALNLAYQSKLLTYNKELNEILPIETNVRTAHYNPDIRKIIQGADRLGSWFSSLPFDQVCINLKITFK